MTDPLLVGVTTCKGRLMHLRVTQWSKLRELDRLVVVDYGCPQRTADALRGADEQLFALRVEDGADLWNPGRARNAGLLYVRQAWAGPVRLVFVDADTELLEGFGAWARAMPDGAIGVADRRGQRDVQELQGLLVVDLERLGPGYEEWPEYGYEDQALRYRLWCEGAAIERVPLNLLRAIRHRNTTRFRYYPQPRPARTPALVRSMPSDYPGRFVP